jgi:hypothetical protein
MKARQWYAAVCGNGHIQSDTLETPVTPGGEGNGNGATARIPKRCRTCSAPVFGRCTNNGCDAPINGYLERDNNATRRHELYADWFCQACERPYVWATSEQVVWWLTSRVRFNSDLDESDQLELLAVISAAGSPTVDAGQFDRLRQLASRSAALAADVRPFLPTLMPLFVLPAHALLDEG